MRTFKINSVYLLEQLKYSKSEKELTKIPLVNAERAAQTTGPEHTAGNSVETDLGQRRLSTESRRMWSRSTEML